MAALTALWGGWYENVRSLCTNDTDDEQKEFLSDDPLVNCLRCIETAPHAFALGNKLAELNETVVMRLNSPLLDQLRALYQGLKPFEPDTSILSANRDAYRFLERLARMDVTTIEFLRSKGVDVFARKRFLFLRAASAGNTKLCSYCCEKTGTHSESFFPSAFECRLFSAAIESGNVETTSWCLKTFDREPIPYFGSLAVAAAKGCLNMVVWYIEHCKSLIVERQKAMLAAVKACQIEVCRYLLTIQGVRVRNHYEWFYAIRSDRFNTELCALLMPRAEGGVDGANELLRAAIRGRIDICLFLLQLGFRFPIAAYRLTYPHIRRNQGETLALLREHATKDGYDPVTDRGLICHHYTSVVCIIRASCLSEEIRGEAAKQIADAMPVDPELYGHPAGPGVHGTVNINTDARLLS